VSRRWTFEEDERAARRYEQGLPEGSFQNGSHDEGQDQRPGLKVDFSEQVANHPEDAHTQISKTVFRIL